MPNIVVNTIRGVSLVRGDIFASSAQTLTVPVNCVGVMGKGLALTFKQRYPEMFADYKKRCQRREVTLGTPYLYPLPDDRQILVFPTKHHWRNDSDLQGITRGLRWLHDNYQKIGIQSLATPALGCGLGNLDWDRDVKPLMTTVMSGWSIPVEIYLPLVK